MNHAPRVQIVDYRLGNLFSIQQACRRVGMDAFVSASAESLKQVDGIILPGVGAFGNAMDSLRQLRLLDPLRGAVEAGTPLMGICLGMQLLFQESEEFGQHEGLGLLPGTIRRIPEQIVAGRKLRVPNVGWNHVYFAPHATDLALREGVPDGAYFYFVHSFYADPAEPSDCLTTTQYGRIRYCSAVRRGNILGVQFHPEKSAQVGLRFYENWAQSLFCTKRAAA